MTPTIARLVRSKRLPTILGSSIMVITHTRKMAADDPFDTVSGTLEITGAADAR